MFQHTAARRRLGLMISVFLILVWFQHTAARRRLADWAMYKLGFICVSTHSRPKAAGLTKNKRENRVSFQHTAARRRLVILSAVLFFGGWFQHTAARRRLVNWSKRGIPASVFQHTAARRRLESLTASTFSNGLVSTHSRPKAAGAKSGIEP